MTWSEVEIEIVDIQGTGKCSAGHKVGDKFTNPEEQRKICGSAYHTFYPYLVALRAGGSFPWEENSDEITICCPDYKNPVVFRIKRSKESK